MSKESQIETVFKVVTGCSETLEQAEKAILLFVMDMDFDREAICIAHKKIKEHFQNK